MSAALIAGGGQERGRRGGTPDLAAIAGFAAALKAAREVVGVSEMRDRAEAAAVKCGAIVCGGGERLPNTTCVALPGVRADTQVIAPRSCRHRGECWRCLQFGGRVARSHVLDAMGLEALAGCAIRVSLPWNVSTADVEAFTDAYVGMAARLSGRARAA